MTRSTSPSWSKSFFADRQLTVGAGVVRFLLARMERSFAAARGLVAAIDRAALESRRDITVPLARQVLRDLTAASERDVTP